MEIELDFSTYLKEYEKYEDIYLKLIETTFNYLGLNFIPNISVSLINNEEIHQINKEYRQVDSPTDVISFAYLDSVEDKEEYIRSQSFVILGEIYISIPRAMEQAENFNHSLHREMCFLFVHGLLHLLGYDHMEKNDETIMFSLQEKLLEKEGILR